MFGNVVFAAGFMDRLRCVLDAVEGQRTGRAEKLAAGIQSAARQAARQPRSGKVVYGGFRRVLVPKSDYLLFYRYEGGTVLLLAVVHGAMGPGNIQRILKQESADPRSDIEPA